MPVKIVSSAASGNENAVEEWDAASGQFEVIGSAAWLAQDIYGRSSCKLGAWAPSAATPQEMQGQLDVINGNSSKKCA